MRVRTKLILSYAFVIALCLALAAAVSAFLLRRYQNEVTDQYLVGVAETVAIILHENNDPARFDSAALLDKEARQTGTRMVVATALLRDFTNPRADQRGKPLEGTVVQDTEDTLTSGARVPLPREIYRDWQTWGRERAPAPTPAGQSATATPRATAPPLNAQLTLPVPERRRIALRGGVTGEAVLIPLQGERGTPGFRVLIVTERPGIVARPFAQLAVRLLWAAGSAFLVSILVALLLARSITGPLVALTDATRALARGEWGRRVPVSGRDEVAELARGFNTMAGEIEATCRRERDFLANISHDLKTPLTSIQGFAGAIVDGTCPPDAYPDAARIIHTEAGRMNRLVGEVLELARLEAGQLALDLAPLDLATLLRDTARRFGPAAAEAGVTLGVQAPPPEETSFAGDRVRLEQALGNLIENALRHTPRGGHIALIGEALDTAPATGVQITVRDTGGGIPPEDLSRIFERFYQADKARQAGRGGSGLGLAIVKELVERHGGTIRAESTVGIGTSIIMVVPASTPLDQANGAAVSSAPRAGAGKAS